jgi:hypothetical protein
MSVLSGNLTAFKKSSAGSPINFLLNDTRKDSVNVDVKPQTVFIEKSDYAQYLNFDFILTNHTSVKLFIREIQLSVFDQAGKLAYRDFMNPYERESLEFFPQSSIEPNGAKLVFNPFPSFRKDMPLNKLLYEFVFSSEDNKIYYRIICIVNPVFYETRTNLILPLKGRILIWDGHDYNSHHRRMNYTAPYFANQGTKANYQRYGYDFLIVDDSGSIYHGASKNVNDWYTGKKDENSDYYSFGVPVYATGNGVIADVHDGEPDNRKFDNAELSKREKAYGGNYIIIDHGNGEYSWFGHLKQGSTRVKIGEKIKQGDIIAAVGASGSSLFPHLHYELRNGDGAKNVEGIPSYFTDFFRVLGKKKILIKKGQANSGEILENN